MSNPNGPQAGGSLPVEEDLAGNGDNPNSKGDRWTSVVAVETSAYPTGAGMVPGYYVPPSSSGVNPYSAASTPDDVVDFSAVPGRVLGSGIAPEAPAPTLRDYWVDGGFGADGNGRSV